MKIVTELPFKKSLRNSLRSNDHGPFVTVKGVKYPVMRLRSFAIHGCTCCRCGAAGNKIIAYIPGDGIVHVDLFGGKHGRLLMTKDHIIPRSKGGRNHWMNYQTMCSRCNAKKADQETTEDWKLSDFRERWNAIHVKFQNRFHRIASQRQFYTKSILWFRDRYLHRFTYIVARIFS